MLDSGITEPAADTEELNKSQQRHDYTGRVFSAETIRKIIQRWGSRGAKNFG